ncbi:hypothetical protein KIN20_015389 [Parelaphostrongylus tenuis]|uniref:Uncharacterized protein n=1 Tax=Parelaphostrongylus tenuis TaxID=148309 RepID=A0AAD5N094_PARTN|nr:hypothetical protein KIN20_015389 [Parelaphostrongylus tenuis]
MEDRSELPVRDAEALGPQSRKVERRFVPKQFSTTSTEQDEDGTMKCGTTGGLRCSHIKWRFIYESIQAKVPLQVSLGEEINRYLMSGTGGSLKSSSVGGDVFSSLNDMKPAILNARTNEELVDNFDRGFRVRPSVALIEKKGIVRDRVKMFKQLENSIPVPL